MGSLLEKNSAAVRKRIEGHTFTDEEGDEYGASEFGGFGDYFRRKKIKLQNLDVEMRASAGDKPQIFKGVVAHVMGYTQPSLHVLHRDLVQHGAGFLQYLDSKTMATHIIASALPPKKAVEYHKYRIVKPAWVTESIQAGRLLPWSDYRVIDESPRQKTIKVDGGKMVSQATQRSQLRYREQTQNSYYTARLQAQESPNRQVFADVRAAHMDSIEDPDVVMGNQLLASAANETPSKGPTKTDAREPNMEIKEFGSTSPAKPPPRPHELSTSPKGKQPLTSEEHNAQLLSDPHVRKSSTANPEFLKQYYSESRLHHLSTWKAELKSAMQKRAADKGLAARAAPRRKPGSRRYVMHVDFDSFFCAVSLKKHPECADKPAAVAHSSGSGSEIASCNYPAREFGVRNGMWMRRAQELCPDLKILPYDFPAYEEASRLFYDAILDVGGVTQSVSIDEALVDITTIVLSAAGSDGAGVDEGSIWREQKTADEIASALRDKTKARTGCHVSVGIGGNILLAKVALRKAKPAGQHQVKPEEVLDVLGELKVEQLPGVAHSIGGKLEEIGVRLVSDVRQTSRERLTSVLGPKTGERLWDYARGIDRAEVGEQPVRKSVSAEVNWGIRFVSQQEAEDFVGSLCGELERRLLAEGVRGTHLAVKIMRRSADAPLDPPKHLGHGKCDTFSKSAVFGVATSSGERIAKEAVAILRSYRFSPGDLRGLGVQLTKLEPIRADVAAPNGSQKRLSFAPPTKKRAEAIDDEDDELVSAPRTGSRRLVEHDPIADVPITPRKPRVHPALALAKANEADEKARTPLNISGTQFILPSNADPAVLAELPSDIRNRLAANSRNKAGPQRNTRDPTPSAKKWPPQHPTPTVPPAAGAVPPPDVDPDVFRELPEDVRAEILASYGPKRGPSPRRRIAHPLARETKSPDKRKVHDLFTRARQPQGQQKQAGPRPHQQVGSTAGQQRPGSAANGDPMGQIEELDPEFLAELPEDVRREVVEDHRRQQQQHQRHQQRLRDKSSRQGASSEGAAVRAQNRPRLAFPPRPPTVRFTGSALTSADEVREMLSVWHRETRAEGPHRADVAMFEQYLARVVADERHMDKAQQLVAWLEWLVGEGEEGKGQQRWTRALHSVKEAVQEAVRGRGLGAMDLG